MGAAALDQSQAEAALAAVGWVVLAFVLYAVARYLTADIEYVARLEMIQVLMYAFLFFAIVNNLYRQEYGAGHQLHADISGDGHFGLRGVASF